MCAIVCFLFSKQSTRSQVITNQRFTLTCGAERWGSAQIFNKHFSVEKSPEPGCIGWIFCPSSQLVVPCQHVLSFWWGCPTALWGDNLKERGTWLAEVRWLGFHDSLPILLFMWAQPPGPNPCSRPPLPAYCIEEQRSLHGSFGGCNQTRQCKFMWGFMQVFLSPWFL